MTSSLKGKRLVNVSAYSRYYLSVSPLDYIQVNGGSFVYPEKYSVDFSGLPNGYARVGSRIVPTCSLWPVYSFLSNGTVYGLFRVLGNFTVYPELIEYHETPTKTNTPSRSETTSGANSSETTTAEKEKSICGPGIIVLLALLVLRKR